MGLNKEIIEIKCDNCGKGLYVFRNVVRDKMFCTLRCLSRFEEKKN